MDRRTFLKYSAGAASIAALSIPAGSNCSRKKRTPYNLYWGDMHCHCGMSYGKGSPEDAFEAAKQQRLDFCALVGHSSWHDTPRDSEHMNRIKDYIVYHDEGYIRLENMWPKVKELTRNNLKPGKFIPFLAFEWHSIKYGDYNVYYLEPEGEIIKANSIEELREKMKNHQALIIPHHIAYLPGSRGIDWNHFVESPQSPFVEVYSFHGCSVTDTSPYPNLREMGPRSYEATMEAGLRKGYKFGISASTDNHYGYPGSFGEGKIAVYASELTQQSLWEAFKERRIYAVSGDRIVVDFSINDSFMGQEIKGADKREIEFSISGEDFIDYVDIIKNGKVIKRFNPEFNPSLAKGKNIHAKIRFEWGWGVKDRLIEWNGELSLTDGKIISLTPCFRPQPIGEFGKDDLKEGATIISRITEQNENSFSFHSCSIGNPTPLTPFNNSVVLNVDMPLDAKIKASVNGRQFEHTLAELLEGQRSHLTGGYLDTAVSFYKAVPEKSFTLNGSFIDSKTDNEIDYYYLSVRQKNNQWAWASPIWIKS